MLTDVQVEVLEAQRKVLNLSLKGFIERLAATLKKEGCAQSDNPVKTRIDRVFNPQLRCT